MRSDAHWVPVRRRRQEDARLQEVRRRSLMAQATQEAPRLKQRYESDVRPQLQRELGLRNVMEVPRLEKIVLNCGVGLATQQQSLLDGAVTPIGAKVTLRGARMWEFYDRLVSLAIPRIRDFRGMEPSSFDGRGNYTFGITEQLIFPEIDYDSIDTVRGMDITIVTTANSDDEGRALLSALGFPFRRESERQSEG